MFVTDNNGDEVNEYTLSIAWDVSSASFVDSLSVSTRNFFLLASHSASPERKCLSHGAHGDDVNEYTLATAWDVSSASFVDSFSVKSQDAGTEWQSHSASPERKCLSRETIMIAVFEYTLATAWDVSSASFVDSFSVASEDTAPNGMFL